MGASLFLVAAEGRPSRCGHLKPSRPTLEDCLPARWGNSGRHADSRTSSYRRYQGRREGSGGGLVGDYAGRRRRDSFASAASSGCCCLRGSLLSSAPCRMYLRSTTIVSQLLSATRSTFTTSSTSKGSSSSSSRSGSVRVSSRRTGGQRAADLSVETADARRVPWPESSASWRSSLLLVTWVAGHAAARPANAVCRQLLVRAAETCRCFLPSRLYSFLTVLAVSFMMHGAVILSNNSRFVCRAVRRRLSVYAGRVPRDVAGHATVHLLVDFRSTRPQQVGSAIFRQTPQYETPWGISLLVVVTLVAVSIWILERRVRGVEVVA